MISERPRWPYVLGSLGAPLFGLGALLLFWEAIQIAQDNRPSAALLKGVMFCLGLGSSVLGVAWLGVFREKQCGFGVIGGSFAVPLAMLAAYVGRNEWGVSAGHALLLVLALGFFAMGHAFLTTLPAVRVVAAVAAIGFVIEIATTTAHVRLGLDGRLLVGGLSLGGLVLTGVMLTFGFQRLYGEVPGEEPDITL